MYRTNPPTRRSPKFINPRVPEVVHVRTHEPAVVQLPEVVGRLVVAPDEQRRVRRACLAGVVLVERPQLLVLVRHGHALQVVDVPHRLEIAAADQQVDDVIPSALLQVAHRRVDLVQLAVAAPLHRDLHDPTVRARAWGRGLRRATRRPDESDFDFGFSRLLTHHVSASRRGVGRVERKRRFTDPRVIDRCAPLKLPRRAASALPSASRVVSRRRHFVPSRDASPLHRWRRSLPPARSRRPRASRREAPLPRDGRDPRARAPRRRTSPPTIRSSWAARERAETR